MSTTRRDVIKKSLFVSASAAIATACGRTPHNKHSASTTYGEPSCEAFALAQHEGPFYPESTDWIDDQDLTTLYAGDQVAQGEQITLSGLVQNESCQPITNAFVEIWQADFQGVYNHSHDPRGRDIERDPNFQYWARAQTQSTGHFGFKTIKPGAYPAGRGWVRPAHIHMKITAMDYLPLTTQVYFESSEKDTYDLEVLEVVPGLAKAYQQHGGAYVTSFLLKNDAILSRLPKNAQQQVILRTNGSRFHVNITLNKA